MAIYMDFIVFIHFWFKWLLRTTLLTKISTCYIYCIEFSRFFLQRAKNTDDFFDPEILLLNFEMKFCLYPEIYLPWTMCKTDHLCSKAPPLGAVNVDTSTPPAQVSKVSCAGPTGFNSHSKVYSMVALIFPKKDGLCLFLLSNNFFFLQNTYKI